MSIEKAKEFLNSVNQEEVGKPETKEETIAVYAAAAKDAGYDISEEEIAQALESLIQDRKDLTDESLSGVEALAPEELDQVAAGGGRIVYPGVCDSSFGSSDNCSSSDKCFGSVNAYRWDNRTFLVYGKKAYGRARCQSTIRGTEWSYNQ